MDYQQIYDLREEIIRLRSENAALAWEVKAHTHYMRQLCNSLAVIFPADTSLAAMHMKAQEAVYRLKRNN